jgi:hypothetical protein
MAQWKASEASDNPRNLAALEKQRRSLTPRHRSPNFAESLEPDLVMLLAEPEVRLLMRADQVDERELMALLYAVRAQMRANSGTERHDEAQNSGNYRPGVGIVLLNERGEVFIGRRADVQNCPTSAPV